MSHAQCSFSYTFRIIINIDKYSLSIFKEKMARSDSDRSTQQVFPQMTGVIAFNAFDKIDAANCSANNIIIPWNMIESYFMIAENWIIHCRIDWIWWNTLRHPQILYSLHSVSDWHFGSNVIHEQCRLWEES